MPQGFISGLKTAATSPYAFVAYLCLLSAWAFVVVAQQRLRRIAKVIGQVPPKDRAALLAKEYNVFPRSGLSAEQWIRSRRHTLLFYAFLSLVIAALALATVALTLRKEAIVKSADKTVDWQMFLYLTKADFSDAEGKTIATKSCDDVSRQKANISDPVVLPRNTPFELTGGVRLVVDNVFRTHQNMIYPIGLTTTWDHTVHTVYDGADVQKYRESISLKFQRDFLVQVTLQTPSTPGTHYILIMSGATMSPRQIFAAAVDEKETSQSMWSVTFPDLAGSVCGGYIKHPFLHPDGETENATWPIIAIPVQIQ